MKDILRESSSEIHRDLIKLIKECDLFVYKACRAVKDSFSISKVFLVKGRVEFFDEDYYVFLDGVVDINNIPLRGSC
jgi:hypothetical protein